jgi:hypothetical protein
MPEPAVHFRHRALRVDPCFLVRRPDARLPFRQVESDAKRIWNLSSAVDQQRHLACRRKLPKVIIIVRLGERLQPVFKGNTQCLHQHPWAQAPA